MTKQLGPTFGNDVIAAGLGGLPFGWGATDDDITGRENLTPEQNARLDTVVAKHDSGAHKGPAPPFTSTLDMGGTFAEVIGED
jgi:hypothetical protein